MVQLSSLSGLGGAPLRDCLGGAAADRMTAAAAFALLDETALIRLVLLLAPSDGAARTDLRFVLRRSPRRPALAAIAAELLVTGAIEHEKALAVPTAEPARPGAAACFGWSNGRFARAVPRLRPRTCGRPCPGSWRSGRSS